MNHNKIAIGIVFSLLLVVGLNSVAIASTDFIETVTGPQQTKPDCKYPPCD